MDLSQLTDARAALAICAANSFMTEALRNQSADGLNARGRWLVQLASTCVDFTAARPGFVVAYQSKPADMSDINFMMAHGNMMGLVNPDEWPKPKVPARDWREYTKVMKTLMETLKFLTDIPNALVKKDLEYLAVHLTPHMGSLKEHAERGLHIARTET